MGDGFGSSQSCHLDRVVGDHVLCHDKWPFIVDKGKGVDQVCLARVEGLYGLIPFFHLETVRYIQFLEDRTEYSDVVAISLTSVITVFIGWELPVTDDDKRTVLSIFAYEDGLCRQDVAEGCQEADDQGGEYSFCHVVSLLYAFHFNQFAGQGNPDGGALAFLRLELDLATHVLHELVADAKSQSCTCIISCDEALKDVVGSLCRNA